MAKEPRKTDNISVLDWRVFVLFEGSNLIRPTGLYIEHLIINIKPYIWVSNIVTTFIFYSNFSNHNNSSSDDNVSRLLLSIPVDRL